MWKTYFLSLLIAENQLQYQLVLILGLDESYMERNVILPECTAVIYGMVGLKGLFLMLKWWHYAPCVS